MKTAIRKNQTRLASAMVPPANMEEVVILNQTNDRGVWPQDNTAVRVTPRQALEWWAKNDPGSIDGQGSVASVVAEFLKSAASSVNRV